MHIYKSYKLFVNAVVILVFILLLSFGLKVLSIYANYNCWHAFLHCTYVPTSIYYVCLKIVVMFCLQGQDFAKEHGLVFMETSAKTAANVEDVSN